jgi:hypothetical protein
MLRGGVTTARNVGSSLAALRPPSRLAGQRLLMAGPLVTVPGGYPTPLWGSQVALDVRGPADARRAVRTLVRRGAAVVKISLEPGGGAWPLLTVAEVQAIVSEATGTASTSPPTPRGRRESGVRSPAASTGSPTRRAAPTTLRHLVTQRIPVVATLHVLRLAVGGCDPETSRFVDSAAGCSTAATSETAASPSASTSTSCG